MLLFFEKWTLSRDIHFIAKIQQVYWSNFYGNGATVKNLWHAAQKPQTRNCKEHIIIIPLIAQPESSLQTFPSSSLVAKSCIFFLCFQLPTSKWRQASCQAMCKVAKSSSKWRRREREEDKPGRRRRVSQSQLPLNSQIFNFSVAINYPFALNAQSQLPQGHQQ